MIKISSVIIVAIALGGCGRSTAFVLAEQTTGGSVDRGEHLLYSYNCGSCHSIRRIPEAKGTVGPPLDGFANRSYIAGSLVNTPENLVRWIKDPKQIEPESAMPKLGLTSEQAVDIAAYLYTLR
jgi:cytochrome c2